VVGALGAALILVGVALAAVGPPTADLSTGAEVVLAFVVVGALVGAVLKLRGTAGGAGEGAGVAWAPGAAFGSPRPEDAATDHDLSSAAVAAVVDRAATRGRELGIDEGVAVVRPQLRETLAGALVAGGRERRAVEAAIEDGTWTDDDVAASVLSAAVDPPARSLRHRARAWLYPERAVRRRVRRAVDAVAAVADEALPAVPGEAATRTVPVVRPTLSELQRGVDGRLQAAADPTAVARGPLPPEPSLEADDPADGESP
jgi:type II secretory pathway pseudopilin PulG